MATHTVTQGDCLSSIAERYGFFWETLWNAPENSEIVRVRKDPNTLMPGDVVFIPEKRMKSFMRSTGAKHTWKMKGVPAKFRIRLEWGDEPRANEPYVLTVDGDVHEGRTDGDGKIEVVIRPDAQHATLIVGEGDTQTEYSFMLGAMPPPDEPSGALERLRSLGFYSGDGANTLDDEARAALRAFQTHRGLAASGELDDATRDTLRQLHDGV